MRVGDTCRVEAHGVENACIESFQGKFREECLNEHWILTLDDARETIESWRIDYNNGAPLQRVGLSDAHRSSQ